MLYNLCTVALKGANCKGFALWQCFHLVSISCYNLILVNTKNTRMFTYQGNSQESHRCLQAALIHEGRNSLEHTQEGMELVGHCSWHRSGDKQYHTAHKSCHWCKLVHLAQMWWWLYLWTPQTGIMSNVTDRVLWLNQSLCCCTVLSIHGFCTHTNIHLAMLKCMKYAHIGYGHITRASYTAIWPTNGSSWWLNCRFLFF